MASTSDDPGIPPADGRTLSDVIEPTVLVLADTPCQDIEQLFGDAPHLGSVVVAQPDGELEVLTRRRWALEYTGRIGYGRALYARHPVSRLPGGGETLVLDGATPLPAAGRAALDRRGRLRYDDIVVPQPGGAATVSIANLFSELALLHAHRSLHDPLTGLANRELFIDRLGAAVTAPATTAAVLFIDIDDFKSVNDSLGHPAGDELLRVLAARLRDVFRDQDTVARVGGDEFAVLIGDATEQSAIAAAARIGIALAAPAAIAGRSVSLRASVGVALETGDRPSEALLRDADLAMYAAKRGGKDGHAIFAPGMHVEAVDRLELIQDVGSALARGQLHLEYQPVFELATNRIAGAEALLRWTHPERGPIAPLDFIALAEESGAIIAIGRWVLDQALRQIVRWDRDHPGAGKPVVAVNVSPRELELPDFAGNVRQALARAGVDPARLVLEVTETALIGDDTGTLEQLDELTRLGVRVAIDDFGMGFSSLHRLQRLPVGMIKLDTAFVHAMGTSRGAALVGGLLGLADALDVRVVAEGVETAEQLRGLIEDGCRLGQGYHLARPMPPDMVGRLMAAAPRPARR